MKKIALGLFLFCLTTLSINAKDIISDIGQNLETVASEKGDVIVSDNVVWTQDGKQTIDYFTKANSTISSIDLYQEKETILKEGITYTRKINNFFNLTKYRLSKNFYPLENGNYIVLASKELAGYNKTPVVLCFKDDALIWEYEYSQVGEGGFSCAVIENGKIYVLGFHKQVSNYNIVLVALSSDGLLENEIVITGNYDAYPINIYSTGYDLLFAWTSKSHSVGYYQDYSNENKGIVLGKINYDFTGFDLQKFALDNKDLEYKDNAYINGELYILAKTKEISLNTHTDTYVINCDYRFSQIGTRKLEENESLDKFINFNNKIIGVKEANTNLKLRVYNDSFQIEKDLFISKTIYGKEYQDFYLLGNNDNLYLVLEVKDIVSGKLEYHFSSYNDNFEKINSFSFNFNPDSFINLRFKNNYFYFSGEKNNTLLFEAKAHIILKEEILEDEDYTYYDCYYIVNDQKLAKNEYFKTEFDALTTKTYINEQEDYYLRLYALGKTEKKIKNNIIDQAIYDTGKILKFNGKGYLNGAMIVNNYQVMTEGYYIFKQVAFDGREQVKYFTISDLSLKDIASKKPIDNDIEYRIVEERQKEVQFKDTNVEFKTYQKAKHGIFIVLFSLPLGIICGIFLPKLIKRRKKDV